MAVKIVADKVIVVNDIILKIVSKKTNKSIYVICKDGKLEIKEKI